MGLMARLAESPRSVRWHTSRAVGAALYRPAFGAFGTGTVMVRPQRLQGVDRMFIGARCAIYEGAWLAVETNDGYITLGDDNYLGQGVHLHALHPIVLGSQCMLADGVYIGAADHGRHDRTEVRGTGQVTIGDRVFLGQRAVVLGGVTIGDGATIGAHAVVTKDVPADTTVVGVPARPIP